MNNVPRYPEAGGSSHQHRSKCVRRDAWPPGTTLVEFAFIFPIFLLFVFVLFEYGHTMMVANMVTSIAKQAAHQGSLEGTSTADVQALAATKLNAVAVGNQSTIEVKDASSFELSTTDTSSVNISNLPDIELNSAESRQLFIVHVE